MLVWKVESKQLHINMKKSWTTYENCSNIMLTSKPSSILLNRWEIISHHVLSRDEEIALSYGSDQHRPSNINKTDIEAEFEQFYHSWTSQRHIKYPRRGFIKLENKTT